MDPTASLSELGLSLPSPAYIAGALLFGVLGLAAYSYGKRADLTITRWLGVALMLYPYVVTETWALFGLGIALCVAVYWSVQRA